MSVQTALWMAIGLPLAAGAVVMFMPRRAAALTKGLTAVATALAAWAAVWLYLAQPVEWSPAGVDRPLVGLDGLGGLVLLGCAFFSVVLLLYSFGFLDDGQVSPSSYYANFLWVVGAAAGTVLARDMVVLLVFWGLMGVPFFLLINLGSEGADAAAKKTLIVLGGSDSLLILGVAAIYAQSGSLDLLQPTLPLEGPAVLACLCLAAAAFAKAGAIPLHSWVPDAARTAPVPAVALLPASLDKLLGIYLFARLSLGLFEVGGLVRNLFIVIGAATVVVAVMAALVQHNLRRLLGFHAVSQVGYMVLGIATGTAVGVVGGLFHMVNHAIYKSCLFLTAGSAERCTGRRDLDQMGGLARFMPLTFAAALIAALAISGIPPLNGFVSKWMVYQGIVEMGRGGGPIWTVALVAAMFGSALTLASFVKVLHSVFLGQPAPEAEEGGPTPNWLMGLPMGLLAALCLAFGIFAYSLPVRHLLLPALPAAYQAGFAEAAWQPGIATVLLCSALVVGLVVYVFGAVGGAREDEAYVGGESVAPAGSFNFSGVEFYRTISAMPSLRNLYRRAEQGWYDLYELGGRFVGWVGMPLRAFHSGLLLSYVAWCALGLVALLWFFLHTGF
ncbi:MAG: proton-conducting transporter membrane subunit [Planctomycetota bacterium]